jgi:hypothetical protein
MAGARLTAMILTYQLPEDPPVAPVVLPLVESQFLVAVAVADPGRITPARGCLDSAKALYTRSAGK